jgi:hypothetical protein
MGKFFLLHETKLDHRDIKIKKEVLKQGFDLVDVDIYKAFLTGSKGSVFNFQNDDIVWLTSNALVGHTILQSFVFSSGAFVWLSRSSLDLTDKFKTAVFLVKIKLKLQRQSQLILRRI